jgi:hypothetical protein
VTDASGRRLDTPGKILYLETWQAKPVYQAESGRSAKDRARLPETGGDDLRCYAPPPAALPPPMRRVAAVRETPRDSVVETTVRGSARTHSVVQGRKSAACPSQPVPTGPSST